MDKTQAQKTACLIVSDLNDDEDLELAERYRKLNQQLEQDDHTQMIEKLRASAALWELALNLEP